MKNTKKAFAIIMILAMLMSMMTFSAFAEDDSDGVIDIIPSENTSQTADSDIMDIAPSNPSECDKTSSCPVNRFSDTDINGWYHDGIHFCLEEKIMNGTGDNEFTPDGSITRAMIVTMLYRLDGEPAFMNDNVFSDVERGSYYEKAVIWASGKSIVNGYSYDGVASDKFGPNDSITREQFSAIMYRYAKYKEYDMGTKVTVDFGSFKDVSDISSYAVDAMKWACGAGLINGIDSCLKPADTASRAQAAAIFQRFVKYVKNGEAVPEEKPDEPVKPDKPDVGPQPESGEPLAVKLNSEWQYADYSKINSGTATLYYAQNNRKNIVIGVNAGHGTVGGSSQKTYCHPDKSPKATGGSTAEGAIFATAIAGGMTFPDGTPEYKATLAVAQKLKNKLLAAGYDVLMIRNGDDVQLDNIARTVICNNMADCHIAIHFDSDGLTYDKGCFYISTPDAIKNMEPVASTWQKSDVLGKCLVSGLSDAGNKINGAGSMAIDLTQTCYSTVPSIDIELGNQNTVLSDATYEKYAEGLLKGIDRYFS